MPMSWYVRIYLLLLVFFLWSWGCYSEPYVCHTIVLPLSYIPSLPEFVCWILCKIMLVLWSHRLMLMLSSYWRAFRDPGLSQTVLAYRGADHVRVEWTLMITTSSRRQEATALVPIIMNNSQESWAIQWKASIDTWEDLDSCVPWPDKVTLLGMGVSNPGP